MGTLVDNRPASEAVAVPGQPPARPEDVVEDYAPPSRGAPRPARRIAMRARREQEYRLGRVW